LCFTFELGRRDLDVSTLLPGCDRPRDTPRPDLADIIAYPRTVPPLQ
jgi:hypothetical protein